MNLGKMEMNRKWAWESSQGIVKVNLFFFYSKEDEITKWRKSFLRKRTQAKARIVRYYKTHLQDENEQRKTNKENDFIFVGPPAMTVNNAAKVFSDGWRVINDMFMMSCLWW